MKTSKSNETIKRRIAFLLVLGMLPWAGLNAQQTDATTFKVSAKVEESCEVSAPDLALVNRTTQGGALLPAAIELSVTCTQNTTYSVGLNKGRLPGATIGQFNTVSRAQASNNQLHSDSARTAISGKTTGTDKVTGVGTGQEVDHTLFGGAPATQLIPAGEYADTVTVRVHY